MRRLDRIWFANCLSSAPFFLFIILFLLIFLISIFFDQIFIKFGTGVQLNLLKGIIIIAQNYNGMLLNETIRMDFINISNRLFSNLILFSCMSLLIPLQMAVIKNMVEKIRQNFKRIEFNKSGESLNINLYSIFEERFNYSNWYYGLFLTIFLPFAIISKDYSLFYLKEEDPNRMVLIFDIFYYSLDVISIFLFFFILWIIFNFAYSLMKISHSPFKDLVILDPISTDNLGGLGPLKQFILNQILLYSICITIAVFSYIDAMQVIFRYESYVFLLMLIIGIGTLIYSLLSIQELLRYKKEKAIKHINELYMHQNSKFEKIILEDHDITDDSELNKISTIINEIKTEKEIIMSMRANLIDLRTLGTVISSILLPIIIKMIESLVIHT
jgi:hypothetical protein